HSVDLSQFNLKNMVRLNYNGKTAKPVEASSLTGRHVSGELIFPVKGDLEEFDIVILGVPKTNERRFEWRS
ncbi:hypothetical protein HYW75_01575, partial [Candidatus Pacearchaeota archaeon]|nr:hypothetical protein [Candidatus Pacearchaeota archaeon]